ncbi:MAG: VWA domain-containing protein [Rhizobiaceae bacterium]
MRNMFEKLTTISFLKDRSGNFSLAFAALATALLMSAGIAINYAQLSMARSNLNNAVDGAVTSTARDITTGVIEIRDAEKMIRAFLDANGTTAFIGGGINIEHIEIDRTAKTVAVAASANVGVAFPLFSGADTRRVSTVSKSLYSDRLIEVAMMLDVTGSMAGHKIEDLKSAAKTAVNTFLAGQDKNDPRIRVAVVPYADSVNVGPLAASAVHVETAYTTGEPPAADDPVVASAAAPDDCATERKGRYQFSDAGPNAAKVNRDYRLTYCPSARMQPLTASIDDLEASINAFRADGFTAGHIGVQWSWYVLSDKWAGFLPAESRPAKANSTKVAKYAILMTDGEFNTAFADVGKREKTRGGQPFRSRSKAERLCAEMKRDGIEIFTIGFDLDNNDARGVMQKCASRNQGSVQHYYEAADGAALEAAFLEIAANIERLTLVK